MSFLPLFGVSILMHGFEDGFTNQFAAFANAQPLVWLATTTFAVLGVSIFGHGSFYTLIKRYEVTLLSPLTLQVPLWGVIFSVIILHETNRHSFPDWRGGISAWRPDHRAQAQYQTAICIYRQEAGSAAHEDYRSPVSQSE